MILPDKGNGRGKGGNIAKVYTLQRDESTAHGTRGRLLDGNRVVCLTLENTDRGLNDSMPEATIKATKKKFKKTTAIQTGTFKVRMSYSGKFEGKKNCCNQQVDEKGNCTCLLCYDIYKQKCGNCKKYEAFYNRKWKGIIPEVIVKGWQGIRMHYGYDEGWTEGCILLGIDDGARGFTFSDTQTKEAVIKVYPEIAAACKKGEVLLKVLPPTKKS